MDDNETVVCVRAESVLDGSEIVCRTAELETVELEEGRGSVLMPAGFDVGFAVWICHTPRLRATAVTGHLSEGSFVRNGVVQIPKFDAKPNPNPMPVRFRQITLQTSELSHIVQVAPQFSPNCS